MGARILVKKADGSHQVDLRSEISSIGRNEDNAVVLDDGAASRHHAQIRLEGGKYFVTDLGSLNGTFLNGVQISGPMELKDGDVVTIGTTNMTFSITPEPTAQTLPHVVPPPQVYETPPVQQAYQTPPMQQATPPPVTGGSTPARPIVPPAGTTARVTPATARPAAKPKGGSKKKLIIIVAVVLVCLVLSCIGGVAAAISQGLITLPQ